MLVVANWKAYVEDVSKAKKLAALAKRLQKATKVRITLAPPAPFIGLLAPRGSAELHFAAQDIGAGASGAHTGELTAAMYASLGARYTLIGHSERRAAGDAREVVVEKMKHAHVHGLTPILCVGEKVRDTEGQYLAELRADIVSAVGAIEGKDRPSILIAYEPVWAINHGDDAINTADLSEMVLYIRKVLGEIIAWREVEKMTILYGGSVEPLNVRGLAGGSGVDGFLVGHASVDPIAFSKLVRALT